MSKAMIGRLILEASAGMHGEESKILADVWADMAQQRAELLEALKKCRFDSLNMSLEDWRFVQEAITKAEAAK